MPESPKFLVSTQKFKEARKVFGWIGKKNGLTEEQITERLERIRFEGEDAPAGYEIKSKNTG